MIRNDVVLVLGVVGNEPTLVLFVRPLCQRRPVALVSLGVQILRLDPTFLDRSPERVPQRCPVTVAPFIVSCDPENGENLQGEFRQPRRDLSARGGSDVPADLVDVRRDRDSEIVRSQFGSCKVVMTRPLRRGALQNQRVNRQSYTLSGVLRVKAVGADALVPVAVAEKRLGFGQWGHGLGWDQLKWDTPDALNWHRSVEPYNQKIRRPEDHGLGLPAPIGGSIGLA